MSIELCKYHFYTMSERTHCFWTDNVFGRGDCSLHIYKTIVVLREIKQDL
jgi:hypothetical protein